jgi:hypothetical protein
MFVSRHGNERARFIDAVGAGDLEGVVSAIKGLTEAGGATVHDGLELLLLLVQAGDPRFERSAKRWLKKFSEEPHKTLAEVQIAAAAVGGLRDAKTYKRSELILRDLIKWIE